MRSLVADHFGALAELRTAGLIRHLGLSNIRPAQLTEARGIAPVVCVQNPYGLGYRRRYDELVEECRRHDIAFVPFFAIAGERRERGYDGSDDDVVVRIAAAHDASPSQIRLAWTLHRGPHLLAIPGTGNPDHLVQNIAAGALRLSPDELGRLDALHDAAEA